MFPCSPKTNRFVSFVSGSVVSRLDFCAGDPRSILAGAEFPTGIQFRVMT